MTFYLYKEGGRVMGCKSPSFVGGRQGKGGMLSLGVDIG